VFQDALLFPHLSVRGNLLYGAGGEGGPTFDEVVRVLDIVSLLDRPADALSGGEARRAAIARALLSGPQCLLLDEPLTGLDRTAARKILTYLHRMLHRFDIPTVYVSHTISDVIFLCDDAWVLRDGRVQGQGPPRSVLTGPEGRIADELSDLENLFMASPEAAVGDAMVFRLGAQRIIVGPQPVPIAGDAMLSVRADDIILAREKPGRLSARNILGGRVTRVAHGQPYGIVFVDVGVEWMVSVTAAAVKELELTEGAEVFAIVKASAIAVCVLPGDPVSRRGS
jgi:molybdate transport system ATP-binding protein